MTKEIKEGTVFTIDNCDFLEKTGMPTNKFIVTKNEDGDLYLKAIIEND